MCFVLADLLHHPEVVDEGKEVAFRKVGNRLGGYGIQGIAKLVNLRP